MPNKPETTFTRSVNKHIPFVYHVKMHNPYTSGIPDVWYSGAKGDLWAEYKFVQNLPVRGGIYFNLTKLQLKWLRDRHEEGRNVILIVGCALGGVWVPFGIFDSAIGLSNEDFHSRLVSRATIAKHILDITGASPCYQ